MTDVFPERLRDKLNILQDNLKRAISTHQNSDKKLPTRSYSNFQTRNIGIRIWDLDDKRNSNSLMISLKPLYKQDPTYFFDKVKPKQRIRLDFNFKPTQQIMPLSSDPSSIPSNLKISKRLSFSDCLVLSSPQKKANHLFIKLNFQIINKSSPIKNDEPNQTNCQLTNLQIGFNLEQTFFNSSLLNSISKPVKNINENSTCSLKEILQKKQVQKYHNMEKDTNNPNSQLKFKEFSILNDKTHSISIFISTNVNIFQFQSINQDQIDCISKEIKFNYTNLKKEETIQNQAIQRLPKFDIDSTRYNHSLKILQRQSTIDRNSRLDIIVSTIKKEQQQQNHNQVAEALIIIKPQQLARDIGQRKPNILNLFVNTLDQLKNPKLSELNLPVKQIKNLKILKEDQVSKQNTIDKIFNQDSLLNQENIQKKNNQIINSLRSIHLSQLLQDQSSNQNFISLVLIPIVNQDVFENRKIQPKLCFQYEQNLQKNRKKIEEIKQLISTSKKQNPLLQLSNGKQQSIKEQKLQIDTQKPIRNVSVSSNDRRQSSVGYNTPIRSPNFIQQKGTMQMSKNEKSPLYRFKKIKYLGRGNISDVYSVTDTITGMMTALKIIQKSVITSKGIQGLIKTEICIQSYIHHPNILKCYGVINDDKQIALVLELGDITLLNYRKEKTLNEKQIIDIIYQVLRGVSYLHQFGIIHRDIKPENILLQGEVVKLADLGICIKATNSQQYCGTPGYMAPEITMNKRYDNKVDCYSVGVLIHELLFGKLPKVGQQINGDTQLIKLMNRLLDVNVALRISCKQALEYEMFQSCEKKMAKYSEMIKNTIFWDY
ncbi:unnamed protein product [Paramecium sonneborni]|uniref:Protein kinase domain-containing protein n=1 Tax=Paramecium sonneborni TaxID=65129 RepID=A0A8S1LNQ5_9CILI|nr:unnamed protein product [Paramecium sonneborni]